MICEWRPDLRSQISFDRNSAIQRHWRGRANALVKSRQSDNYRKFLEVFCLPKMRGWKRLPPTWRSGQRAWGQMRILDFGDHLKMKKIIRSEVGKSSFENENETDYNDASMQWPVKLKATSLILIWAHSVMLKTNHTG